MATCAGAGGLCRGISLRESACVVRGRPCVVAARQQGWTKRPLWILRRPFHEVVEIPHRRRKQRESQKVGAFQISVTAVASAPQNADFPAVLPRNKKKPRVRPQRTANPKPKPWSKRLKPTGRSPDNGLLVKSLIPVAHEVMRAYGIVREGVELLLKEIPVQTCRYCPEVHIGSVVNKLQTCEGPWNNQRKSFHDWVRGSVNDVLVPVEAFHLEDRLGPPITHHERYNADRIPAVMELCIQAGVDVPEYPTKRYVAAVRHPSRGTTGYANWMVDNFASPSDDDGHEHVRFPQRTEFGEAVPTGDQEDEHGANAEETIGSEQTDFGEEVPIGDEEDEHGAAGKERIGSEQIEFEEAVPSGEQEEHEEANDQRIGSGPGQNDGRKMERTPLLDVTPEDDLQIVAQNTLQAWQRMRRGVKKLKSMYRVLCCGYCPEIHVGPKGHRARVCGAFKHQWRDGKHGWQSAAIDEVIPPQYVWHVREKHGPPLAHPLKTFYGKAPALVELCVQAGAPIPDEHRPLMRLDVAIPRLEELDHVI